MKNILITGAAGFIGFHLAEKLLSHNFNVCGIDNFSDSYNVNIKKLRIKKLLKYKNFFFYKKDIKDLEKIFKKKRYTAFFISLHKQV